MTENSAELQWWLEQLAALEAARVRTDEMIRTAREKIKLYSQE